MKLKYPVFIIPSQVKGGVSCSISVQQGYLKDAVRKKQLMFSFVEIFELNLENIRCIDFQFHDAKLSQ